MAVAGISGTVYVVTPWGDVEQLMAVGQCVTVLAAAAAGAGEADVLLCGGHFEGLRIFHEGGLVGVVPLHDWVHSIAVTGGSGGGGWLPAVVVGVGGNRLVAIGERGR